MESWVYIFSQFSSELLLFELFGIFGLIACYSAFWVLKKRKFGTAQETLPSGVVQSYLNTLIAEAQVMRTQLFGLLSDAGATIDFASLMGNAQPLPAGFQAAAPVAAPTPTPVVDDSAKEKIQADPEAAQKLAELELKLNEQVTATSKLEEEKQALEKQLADAKAGAGGDGEVVGDEDLLKKIKDLEDRLAEYSIIEDDLANLKRLQQENEQLRAALAGKGEAPPPPAAEPETPAVEAAPAAAPETAPEAAPEIAAAEPAPAEVAPEPAPEPAAAEPAPEPAPAEAAPAEEPKKDDQFEELVDKVEDSLKPEEPAQEASTAKEDPATLDEKDKEKAGDDDLLNEFERMLNM